MNDEFKTDARSAAETCGCAPTPAEQRALWPSARLTRRSALTVGALSAVALTAFGLSGSSLIAHAEPGYPSWDDVQRAKGNEAAKGAEITRIQQLIQQLTQQAADAEAAAQKAGDEFYAAQEAYFEQAQRAQDLQGQADAQAKIAADSSRKAGQVATQLYRSGGDQAALELFLSDSSQGADGLLSRLGSMDQLLEYNRTIADRAAAARDSAQALTDQAKTARDERDRLQKIAEQKMKQAQAAADAAQAAVTEKESNLETLQAQLAALKDTTAATVAGYQKGEQVRKAREAREAAERKAREEAARKAAEEAAKNNGGGSGGGGGSGSGSGWVRPHGGFISSGYGSRGSVCQNGKCSSSFHRGLDFANGCGAPIYAAASGTVVSRFFTSGYGNYTKISHGGGVSTGYAHQSRQIVSVGQHVSAGQVIGYSGNTGRSLGCHLHFEVYTSAGTINPAPFLRARGVSV
ncbi:M23 family metallopeptidase [uncultured Microbacterium sp.]|uniref:M23 family metallopeptidase n=1 Tax=uncultured Microbacterium sp. TaxID=191216 RepID=UPI002606B5F8|nr:M23 family metallopeptidase [uncultured Microbacterium sp.]